MAVNRFAKDYRLVESADEKGRLRTSAEYVGADYFFASGAACARPAARRCAVLCALAWVGQLAALIPHSGAMRRLWSSLPAAFAVLPLWLLSSAVFTALRAKEPMRRREAEVLNSRLPAAAIFAALLSGMALFAAFFSLLFSGSGMLPGDLCFPAGEFISAVCALLCFRKRTALAAKQT